MTALCLVSVLEHRAKVPRLAPASPLSPTLFLGRTRSRTRPVAPRFRSHSQPSSPRISPPPFPIFAFSIPVYQTLTQVIVYRRTRPSPALPVQLIHSSKQWPHGTGGKPRGRGSHCSNSLNKAIVFCSDFQTARHLIISYTMTPHKDDKFEQKKLSSTSLDRSLWKRCEYTKLEVRCMLQSVSR